MNGMSGISGWAPGGAQRSGPAAHAPGRAFPPRCSCFTAGAQRTGETSERVISLWLLTPSWVSPRRGRGARGAEQRRGCAAAGRTSGGFGAGRNPVGCAARVGTGGRVAFGACREVTRRAHARVADAAAGYS